NEFATSTSDAVSNTVATPARRELPSREHVMPVDEPVVADVVDEPQPNEQFDVTQARRFSSGPQRTAWKIPWGIIIVVGIVLLKNGNRIGKMFQRQPQPVPNAVQPADRPIERDRNQGNDLKPPKKPFRGKFKQLPPDQPAPQEQRIAPEDNRP